MKERVLFSQTWQFMKCLMSLCRKNLYIKIWDIILDFIWNKNGKKLLFFFYYQCLTNSYLANSWLVLTPQPVI